jgi:phosphoglucosamine mutase
VGRLFGTDGVRGLANREVTAELALDLAVSAAHVLAAGSAVAGRRPEAASRRGGAAPRARTDGRRGRAVVARDPRASGEFLSAAVVAGLASAGMDVDDVGVLPTPGLAHVVASREDVDLGVMISASHNPMPDNGIKFFDHRGAKLPDDIEDAIAAGLQKDWDRPLGREVGRVRPAPQCLGEYVDHLVATLSQVSSAARPLDGLRVVVDCAHGAACVASPAALRAAGADVVVIGAEPDGWNINDGYGSTHLERLQEAVLSTGADAGMAHDGDADRCLAVDERGAAVDGDQILAILALALSERGWLPTRTVVTTVMSNIGLGLALAEHGIGIQRTAVGDRYVLEAMRNGGHVLGGEQSGHVVMLDHATTGDGVLTALHVLARMTETGRSLSALAGVMRRYPQVLVNVPGVDKARLDDHPEVARAVRETESRLGATGRVLLRASGTEPVVRVMVEAPDEETAKGVAEELAAVVASHLSPA